MDTTTHQALENSTTFGRAGVFPAVYDLIRNCLHDISKYYETEQETDEALQCLRTFGANNLPPHMNAKLEVFLTKLEGKLSEWGFFVLKLACTMLERCCITQTHKRTSVTTHL